MTEVTFESVKGKLEVIAPYLRHSHATKVITNFQNTTSYEQNFLISKEKQPLQASCRRFIGRSVRIVAMGSHLFCHHCSLMSRTQRQASRLSLGLDWLGLHSARRLHRNVILAHCVIFIHLLHREWVTLQTGRVSHRPCGLSRVQQCEREWRCLECECE